LEEIPEAEESTQKIYSTSDKLIGTIYALIGAIAGGLAGICMRVMNQGVHYSFSPFWYSMGCAILSPAFVGYNISLKE
jgi:hypothetical protein